MGKDAKFRYILRVQFTHCCDNATMRFDANEFIRITARRNQGERAYAGVITRPALPTGTSGDVVARGPAVAEEAAHDLVFVVSVSSDVRGRCHSKVRSGVGVRKSVACSPMVSMVR